MPDINIVDRHGKPMAMSGANDSAHLAASIKARELAAWTPPNSSADTANFGEINAIAARAYDLERNNGIAGGAIRTSVDNIVGTGLQLSAKPDWRSLGMTPEWADEWAVTTESKWRSFADVPEFDAGRQLTFGGMTVLQLRTAFLAGEALALPLWLPQRPGSKWATAMQSIDPARLEGPEGQFITEKNRDGVEVSRYGEPIAYWIRRNHPGDIFSMFSSEERYERVPARTRFGRKRVIHLYDKKRPGQSRGTSILANVMAGFRMLDHYQRIEMQTAVINSMIAAFIETPLNGEDIASLFGTDQKYIDSRNNWDVKLDGGSIIPLHPGDKLNSFNPGRPNSAYQQFIETVVRTIGAGMNMPYELILKDFSRTNYSSARAALMEAWRYFMGMRTWRAQGWRQPVYELWLEEAISKGEIEAPGFYDNRFAYCRARWRGPGRGWIDPQREAQAAETRMKNSISTLEDECADQGKDWEEVLEQRAKERKRGIDLGLEDVHAPPQQGGAPVEDPEDDADEQDDELRSAITGALSRVGKTEAE